MFHLSLRNTPVPFCFFIFLRKHHYIFRRYFCAVSDVISFTSAYISIQTKLDMVFIFLSTISPFILFSENVSIFIYVFIDFPMFILSFVIGVIFTMLFLLLLLKPKSFPLLIGINSSNSIGFSTTH